MYTLIFKVDYIGPIKRLGELFWAEHQGVITSTQVQVTDENDNLVFSKDIQEISYSETIDIISKAVRQYGTTAYSQITIYRLLNGILQEGGQQTWVVDSHGSWQEVDNQTAA